MPSRRHTAAETRLIWPPEPGYFRLRLVKGGWAVPARIIHEDGLWTAEINGEARASHADPVHADGLANVWHYGSRSSLSEYRWLIAFKEHALEVDPTHPAANPNRPIDLATLKPLPPRARPLSAKTTPARFVGFSQAGKDTNP